MQIHIMSTGLMYNAPRMAYINKFGVTPLLTQLKKTYAFNLADILRHASCRTFEAATVLPLVFSKCFTSSYPSIIICSSAAVK